jgi:hypothetical protein
LIGTPDKTMIVYTPIKEAVVEAWKIFLGKKKPTKEGKPKSNHQRREERSKRKTNNSKYRPTNRV